MTLEELNQIRKQVDDKINEAYAIQNKAEWQYIEERLPFPFRRYQQVIVKLEVTEETRKFLTDEYKAKPRYQAGTLYQVKGMLIGYHIGKKGDIRPCFWGGKPYYSLNDKIISITPAKKQRTEKCQSCFHCRKGACYVTGDNNPTQQVDENMFVCGYYFPRGESKFKGGTDNE